MSKEKDGPGPVLARDQAREQAYDYQVRITELKDKAQAIGSQCLDELVHELKSLEASAINNGGAHEQISYIVESMGQKETIAKLEEILK
jgi:hypothetical protein